MEVLKRKHITDILMVHFAITGGCLPPSSYGFFSYGFSHFPMVFLWIFPFSDGFPMDFPIFRWFSYGAETCQYQKGGILGDFGPRRVATGW